MPKYEKRCGRRNRAEEMRDLGMGAGNLELFSGSLGAGGTVTVADRLALETLWRWRNPSDASTYAAAHTTLHFHFPVSWVLGSGFEQGPRQGAARAV